MRSILRSKDCSTDQMCCTQNTRASIRAPCLNARGKCVTAHSDRTTLYLNIPSETYFLEDLLSLIRHWISLRKEQEEGEDGGHSVVILTHMR